jgi:hypothetical protein
MRLSVTSLLRTLGKRTLPHLPLLGPWFDVGFRSRRVRFERRQRIDELHSLRETARLWRVRIADVLACPDNADIPRAPNAGRIVEGNVIMHNGLRVAYGSYGSSDAKHIMRMLEENAGVHEPQEEKIFQQVLPLMPPGAVMLELGAFWGFYSLWFASRVTQARCFLVEPDWANLNAGRLNFALNDLRASFINGSVGARHCRRPFRAPVVAVDWLIQQHRLEKIHLLHCDIQGFEHQMLKGMEQASENGRVDWIFISTHSGELHHDCRAWLRAHGWIVVADANSEQSHSVDGLLAAHRGDLDVPDLQPITRKGVAP